MDMVRQVGNKLTIVDVHAVIHLRAFLAAVDADAPRLPSDSYSSRAGTQQDNHDDEANTEESSHYIVCCFVIVF